jgi:hypothetical protein
LAAAAAGGLADLVLIATGVVDGLPWPVLAVAPGIMTLAVALADRDGWLVRHAMAYVAIQQGKRWTRGPLPMTPSLATVWLTDPANATASPLERATVLFGAGRGEEAGATLERFIPETSRQRASLVRLRACVEGRPTGTIDLGAVRAELDALGLDPEERRYQLASAAWTQAWMDIERRRPWRTGFAAGTRDLGPFRVPLRVTVWVAIQEFAAPIAIGLGTLIIAAFYPF